MGDRFCLIFQGRSGPRPRERREADVYEGGRPPLAGDPDEGGVGRKECGTVEGLLADPRNRECRQLIVRHLPRPGDTRLVPVELVADVRGDMIRLQVTWAHVEGIAARGTA